MEPVSAVFNKKSPRRMGSEAAREHWRRRIQQQQASGETVAAWCRQRGICAPSWFAWRRKLNEEAEWGRRRAGRGKKDQSAFVEVKLTRPAAPIEIRLGSGHRVLVEPGFDAEHLQAVIAALETGR